MWVYSFWIKPKAQSSLYPVTERVCISTALTLLKRRESPSTERLFVLNCRLAWLPANPLSPRMGVSITSLNQMSALNGLVLLSGRLIPVSTTVIPLFTWIIWFACGFLFFLSLSFFLCGTSAAEAQLPHHWLCLQSDLWDVCSKSLPLVEDGEDYSRRLEVNTLLQRSQCLLFPFMLPRCWTHKRMSWNRKKKKRVKLSYL